MRAQHNSEWSDPLSHLQERAHDLAAVGPGMAREGMYPLMSPMDGEARLSHDAAW